MLRFASVLLVDPRGWLLLQERDEHPVIDPDRWGLPGGGIEPGESPAQAAVRELAEETGLVADGPLVGPLSEVMSLRVDHHATGELHDVTVFAAATSATDADVVCGEGRRIVLVDPAAALRLDLTVSAAVALPELVGSAVHRALARGRD